MSRLVLMRLKCTGYVALHTRTHSAHALIFLFTWVFSPVTFLSHLASVPFEFTSRVAVADDRLCFFFFQFHLRQKYTAVNNNNLRRKYESCGNRNKIHDFADTNSHVIWCYAAMASYSLLFTCSAAKYANAIRLREKYMLTAQLDHFQSVDICRLMRESADRTDPNIYRIDAHIDFGRFSCT